MDLLPLLRHTPYLSHPEAAVLLVLTAGADGHPTIRDVATTAKLGRSTVIRSLHHLQLHGWLDRPTRTGRRYTYRLLPRVPDPTCTCPKVPPRDRSVRKGPTPGPLSRQGPATGPLGTVNTSLLRCIRCPSVDTQIMGDGSRACREHAGPRWRESA